MPKLKLAILYSMWRLMNCTIKFSQSEQITFMLFYYSSMTLRAVSQFKLTACQIANKSSSYHFTYCSVISDGLIIKLHKIFI